MDLNHEKDTSDPGRTIGNGVVAAYAVAAASATAMVLAGHLDAMPALQAVAIMFLAVFLGDGVIQHKDMNGDLPEGVRDRVFGDEEEPDNQPTD